MSRKLFDAHEVSQSIQRLVTQIRDREWDDVVLVGIVTGGAVLAERLAAEMEQQGMALPEVYRIDITLYRDDLYTGLEKLALGSSELPLSVDGLNIILVDDVLFTGRTVRAALQEIYDYGRPKCVQLLTLIDRGHRELPIQADFIGHIIESNKQDKVVVTLGKKKDGDDSVTLLPR